MDSPAAGEETAAGWPPLLVLPFFHSIRKFRISEHLVGVFVRVEPGDPTRICQ